MSVPAQLRMLMFMLQNEEKNVLQLLDKEKFSQDFNGTECLIAELYEASTSYTDLNKQVFMFTTEMNLLINKIKCEYMMSEMPTNGGSLITHEIKKLEEALRIMATKKKMMVVKRKMLDLRITAIQNLIHQ
jgi:hypothetical protein